MNQDALGQPAQRLTNVLAGVEIWTKKLADKSFAVGIFNRGNAAVPVNLVWHDLGLRAKPAVRDLWLRKDLGRQKNFAAELPPHGCALLRLYSPKLRCTLPHEAEPFTRDFRANEKFHLSPACRCNGQWHSHPR